jgi:hypothetical protein
VRLPRFPRVRCGALQAAVPGGTGDTPDAGAGGVAVGVGKGAGAGVGAGAPSPSAANAGALPSVRNDRKRARIGLRAAGSIIGSSAPVPPYLVDGSPNNPTPSPAAPPGFAPRNPSTYAASPPAGGSCACKDRSPGQHSQPHPGCTVLRADPDQASPWVTITSKLRFQLSVMAGGPATDPSAPPGRSQR